MFRAIKIVGTIVSFLVGSIGTLHRMDKQGQVDPVAVEEESTQMVRNTVSYTHLTLPTT